jgi:crotonobetaine/carnitine-CoA ligase
MGLPARWGRPWGATEFRVVDEHDREVPIGWVGELVMRHPVGRLTHYHDDLEATEEAYRGGWFHTGDLASVDSEGWFRYVGRQKESMRRRGENVSAWEIENVVNSHPAVLESAAHAVTSDLGEDDIKLTVVLRPNSGLSPAELIDFCVGRIADYALPSYVELRESLPKTGTQRIQYAALKAEGVTASTWRRESSRAKG